MPNDLRYLSQSLEETEKFRLIYYDRVDSTNNRAVEYARRGYPHLTVVIANSQFKGRGRRGREWFSPEGKNIYMSLIYRELEDVTYPELFTLYSSVCVIEALQGIVPEARGHLWSKWPNDIYWDEKKLGGILIEGSLSAEDINFLVIGIGINVNSSNEELLACSEGRGTSLLAESGRIYRRDEIILAILSEISSAKRILKDRETLIRKWKDLSRTVGERVKVVTNRGSYEAVALGVDERGHLIVKRKGDGKKEVLTYEEVVHIR